VYRLEETAEQTIKGSITLIIGNYVSLIINAVGIILVARMLSPSEYGLFTVILVLPNFIRLFTTWGIDQALVNFIARYRSQGNSHLIKNLIITGYTFTFLLSGFLTVILYLSTNIVITTVLHRPEIGEYVKFASLYIISSTLNNLALSILTGFERMDHRATMTIISSLLKGILSPLLVYLGYGVSGVVIGHITSHIGGAIVGLLFVTHTIKNLPTRQSLQVSFQSLKLMLGYGLPLFIGTIIMGFSTQIREFLLSRFIANDIIGNYGVAFRFTNLISIVNLSLGVTLFPAFSKLYVNDELKETEQFYKGSIRYTSLLLIPLISLLITLSHSVISTLFGAKYPLASMYLSLFITPFLLVGIGALSNLQFLKSHGETRATMIIQFTGALLKIILSLLSIARWGVLGLLTAYIISETAQQFLAMIIVRAVFNIQPDLNHTLKTLTSSTISGAITVGLLTLLASQQPLVNLTAGTLLFITSFLLIAPFIGAIEKQDLRNLNTILVKLPIIYPFARIILDLEERLIDT
jgi:O-antigen/teichoic acid export membrane protein